MKISYSLIINMFCNNANIPVTTDTESEGTQYVGSELIVITVIVEDNNLNGTILSQIIKMCI